MTGDGAEHVIYAFYPDFPDPGVRERLDALRPAVEDACASSAVPCHFVDLRPTFVGRSTEYTDLSGMIPNALGSEATARAIWSVLQRECIAQ
jgi:hypothetical protein